MIAYSIQNNFSVLENGIEYEFDRVSVDKFGERKISLINKAENLPVLYSEDDIHQRINSGEMEVLTSGIEIKPGSLANTSFIELTPHQKSYENRVYAYCKGLDDRGITKGQRDKIQAAIPEIANEICDVDPPSDSTVMRWMRETGGNPHNYKCVTEKFIQQNRASRKSAEIIAVANEVLANYHFISKTRLQKQDDYQTCTARINDELQVRGIEGSISLGTVKKIIYSKPAYERDVIRLGVTEAKHKHRHSSGGKWPTRPFERVELDHTELDIKVIDRASGLSMHRPTITVIKDYYTGYILSFWISFEGESIGRITKAIRIALENKRHREIQYGLEYEWLTTPIMWEKLVLDNALAHHSEAFLSIARTLGFSIEFSAVRMPWMKGSIESFIRLLNKAMPEHGKPTKPNAVKSKQSKKLEVERVFFDNLVKYIHHWVADYYPHFKNSRKISSPYIEMQKAIQACEGLPKINFTPESYELRIATSQSIFRKIGAAGYETSGLTYRSRELSDLVQANGTGKKYEIRQDLSDIGEVFIRNPITNEWIVVPEMNPVNSKGKALYQHKLDRKAALDNFEKLGGAKRDREARINQSNAITRLVRDGKKQNQKKPSAKNSRANAKARGVTQDAPYGHAIDGTNLINEIKPASEPKFLDPKSIGTFNNTITKA